MQWRIASAAAMAVLSLSASTPARAQSSTRLSPVGGRSQLLGGTGLAFGRDAASSYLNPATAVSIDDRRLSFSVNFYSISMTRAPSWYTPGNVDQAKFPGLHVDDATMTQYSFSALPSSLCLVFRAKDLKRVNVVDVRDPVLREARLGFCLATVQGQEFGHSDESFSQTFGPHQTRQAQTINHEFRRFSAGPVYALHFNEVVSVGAALHVNLTNEHVSLASAATTYGGNAPIGSMFYTTSHGTSLDVEAIVGTTLRWGKQTLGVSLASPSVHVFGTGGLARESHYDGAGEASSSVTGEGTFVSRQPARIGIGTGVQGTWGQAELDMFVSAPSTAYSSHVEGRTVTRTGGAVVDQPLVLDLEQRASGAVNLAAGAEGFISERISLLGGLSTDISAVPSGALGHDTFGYFQDRIHRVAGSFGLGTHGPDGELLLGGELSVGSGQRLAVNSYELPPTVTPTNVTNIQLIFIIAGSTSFRNIVRAYQEVKKVVDPTKKDKVEERKLEEDRRLQKKPAP